jgi:SNF2 family DNA or RNA helicase
MSTLFKPAGPERYLHQKVGLRKCIETGGVTALLFDPGMGKTAVALDYASLLALKSVTGEARVLVVCPLAAVDTWVMQAEKFVSEQVNYWAESIGGGLLERAETLAARGGQPFRDPLLRERPPAWIKIAKVAGIEVAHCTRCDERYQEKRAPKMDAWWQTHVKVDHPEYKPRWRKRLHHPRALHHEQAWAWAARDTSRARPITSSEGPDGLATPRLVIEVINLDTVTSRMTVGGRTMADVMVDAIRRFNPDLVIIDESHKIKSPTGNASRLMARVSKFVKRRIMLTGTVMPHGPLDVFAQWRFLEPYAFGAVQPDGSKRQATFGQFRDDYAILGGWMGKEVTGYRNLDEMQKIMAKNAVVARKKDALDLPPTTDVVIPVELSPTEKKAYAEMKADLVSMLASGAMASVPSRLTQMMRLRQITSGHLPDDSGQLHIIGASKVNTIRSLVHDTLTGEKRVVIFALFSQEIKMLEAALTAKGTEVMVITGETSGADRMAMRRRFGPEGPKDVRMVMIAQIKTMSLAVNELVTANHAIFASLSQQRDDLIQARDRLDRIGQTRPVTFWYALAPGTVDEVILNSHNERTSLESAMLKHIQEQGNIK